MTLSTSSFPVSFHFHTQADLSWRLAHVLTNVLFLKNTSDTSDTSTKQRRFISSKCRYLVLGISIRTKLFTLRIWELFEVHRLRLLQEEIVEVP
jgi:hypothetical protein